MMPSQARFLHRTLPVSLLLLISCGGTPRREGITPTQAHMYAHFDRAIELHDALVRGELERARRAADWIATHQEPRSFPGNSQDLQAAMQRHAGEVSRSIQLKEATMAAAHMGKTCGDCHRENRVSPRFLVGTAPPGGSGPEAEMIRHVWAAERMWEGLLGPEDHAWKSGGEALRSGWLDPQAVVSNPEDRIRIRELVRQVYVLGGEAEAAADADARAALYGEFLNTCTECHRLTAARIR